MNKKKRTGKKFWRPKGRVLDPQAMAEVDELLSDQPRQRDRLIEFLHQIQDRYGCLHVHHLHALAEWLNIALVEVYEVASFYHHFDIVHEQQAAPAPLTVRVCDSISCMLAGCEGLLSGLGAGSSQVRIQRVPCVGRCDQAPVAVVGQNPIEKASVAAVEQAITSCEVACPTLTPFPKTGLKAYETYQRCLDGELSVEAVIQTLEQAKLRGLGGAGFPVARKWQILRQQPAPRWIAVNIDEGEPGTFKDRFVLEQTPHPLLEGLLIAAWAIDSQQCVLYVRDEYPHIRQGLIDAIAELSEVAANQWQVELPSIQVRRGAGAYICGEESAMLESIEGKRGLPRQRPPFIAEVGLFGQPTLEHNAETLYWVPELIQKGADWFQSHGLNGRRGLRRYSLSGRIKKPGVYLAPAGINVVELIRDYGGGMLDGHTLYGYLPGGASGGILPASLGEVPLDFDTLQEHGCFIGSAAVVVFSQHDRARDIALNAMRFLAHESCGQCTPCRVGTVQASEMMANEQWPVQQLKELCAVMGDASICGLGQAAPNPLRCVMRYFPEEIS